MKTVFLRKEYLTNFKTQQWRYNPPISFLKQKAMAYFGHRDFLFEIYCIILPNLVIEMCTVEAAVGLPISDDFYD